MIYLCSTCGFQAKTVKQIKDQVLCYPHDDTSDFFHRDCIVKEAEEFEDRYEIKGKPKNGRMVLA